MISPEDLGRAVRESVWRCCVPVDAVAQACGYPTWSDWVDTAGVATCYSNELGVNRMCALVPAARRRAALVALVRLQVPVTP